MEKYLLRQTAARWLPNEVAQRRKQPYRAPIHRSFFNGATPEYVSELLSAPKIQKNGYFRPAAVTALVDKLRRGLPVGETDDMALAGILSTQLLHEQFLNNRARSESLPAGANVKICRRERLCLTL
jgi:asparagine synthase (glutamine-hydrolysing)